MVCTMEYESGFDLLVPRRQNWGLGVGLEPVAVVVGMPVEVRWG